MIFLQVDALSVGREYITVALFAGREYITDDFPGQKKSFVLRNG
jgi:hypothetical protein